MKSTGKTLSRRALILATTLSLVSLFACGAAPVIITLDIVHFNYTDRPIFDAFIDGKAGGTSSPYPATGGGTISGVTLTVGPKKVSWRLDGPPGTPHNGDTVVAKNSPVLADVPSDAVYLGVHIYPDTTVELIPTRHYPRPTARGIASAQSENH